MKEKTIYNTQKCPNCGHEWDSITYDYGEIKVLHNIKREPEKIKKNNSVIIIGREEK